MENPLICNEYHYSRDRGILFNFQLQITAVFNHNNLTFAYLKATENINKFRSDERHIHTLTSCE